LIAAAGAAVALLLLLMKLLPHFPAIFRAGMDRLEFGQFWDSFLFDCGHRQEK